MRHLVFVILHIAALLFGVVGLVVTIPLHLIYAAVSKDRRTVRVVDPNAPTPETHVRCPECRELVRADARKCKHCGTALVPVEAASVPTVSAAEDQQQSLKALYIAAAIVAALVFLVKCVG